MSTNPHTTQQPGGRMGSPAPPPSPTPHPHPHKSYGTKRNASTQVHPQPMALGVWTEWLCGQIPGSIPAQAAPPPTPLEHGLSPEPWWLNHRGWPSSGVPAGNSKRVLALGTQEFDSREKPATFTGDPRVLELGCWRGSKENSHVFASRGCTHRASARRTQTELAGSGWGHGFTRAHSVCFHS